MFRSIDIHGHPSRPSEIYEVELINDGEGAVYPRIRVVEPNDVRDNKTSNKKVKRFLQLKPQLSQRLFNSEETFSSLEQDPNASAPVADTIALGYEAVKIWYRQFECNLQKRILGPEE